MACKNIYIFLNKKWFFDKLYNILLAQHFLNFSFHTSYKTIDKGFLEIFGPLRISNFLYNLSLNLAKLHSGIFSHYAFVFFISILFYFVLFYFNFLINLVVVSFILFFLVNSNFKVFKQF